MTEEDRAAVIASLVRERDSYERQGKTDRVAAVDAELARLGRTGKAPARRAEKRL